MAYQFQIPASILIYHVTPERLVTCAKRNSWKPFTRVPVNRGDEWESYLHYHHDATALVVGIPRFVRSEDDITDMQRAARELARVARVTLEDILAECFVMAERDLIRESIRVTFETYNEPLPSRLEQPGETTAEHDLSVSKGRVLTRRTK